MGDKIKPYQLDINTLGFYVDRLLYSMIKRQNYLLKQYNSDLQHSEFIVLKVLNALTEASQSQLAKVIGKERSGISRILVSLEKKGYIERKPLNGSTNIVTMTEKGIKFRPLLSEISDQLTELAFKGFSQKSRSATLRNLEKLYKNTIIEEDSSKNKLLAIHLK